ncbi:DUF4349 domain-containing protein [Cupriavidus basilensis]|uniref:DUF4349 domain-containing protein n=1 Tax=Cupriavidus basilensis TaxID=68895 RepID=A0ABT6AJR4_9BURK|nr:DUF4349 domain-containing protein [Cupriavidus basilensis]MDF3832855.1 DUF4349 domain-containing protein [Cupriavidus basilensis]
MNGARLDGARGLAALLLAGALLALAACGRSGNGPEGRPPAAPAAAGMPAAELARAQGGAQGEQQEAERRYLALKYALTVENTAEALEGGWKSVVERCQALGCELLEAGFTRSRDGAPPRGELRARVAPKSLPDLLKAAEQGGTVVSNTVSSEDKTDQVIDAEARIKNTTELRDRLRAMLQNARGPLRDVIELERELARVQAELDTINGLRKLLAAQTDRNEVHIDFVARESFVSQRKVSPLREAYNDIAGLFLGSLAMLIRVAAGALPWLLVGVPLLWLALAWRRRRAARRKQALPAPPDGAGSR